MFLLSSGRTPSLGQTSKLLCNLRTQTVLIHRTQTVLYTSNSNCSLYVELKLFFIRRTQTVLYTLNSNCSCCSELKVFDSTLQQVYSTPSAGPTILNTYFVKSPVSGPFINAYSVKSSVTLYSALCSRTSPYPVSRVYITLQL